ncbi:hypothetical protein ACS0TY_014633 [Phlomoides rotata]
MALEFVYYKKIVGQAKISCRGKLSMIDYVFQQLGDCHKQKCRQTKPMKFGSTSNKFARFRLEEFILIIDLNAKNLEEGVVAEETQP